MQHWLPLFSNIYIMESIADGLTNSFVARHTTDHTLRLELFSRNQNGSRHRDGGRGKKDWIQILDVERDTDNALWVYWGRKGVVKVILNHQNWSWDRSFYWILSHKLSKKADSLYDKKIPQRITKKLRKIVVVFVVTAVPFRCFAISLQKKHCQFLFTWNKNSLDLWGIKTSILGG